MYALVEAGEVVGFLMPIPDVSIADQIHANYTPVDVTGISPQPRVGWTYDGSTFSAPPPLAPTLPQQAVTLMNSGLTVTSTGTPALDGTYPCDTLTQQQVSCEIVSLLLNQTFTDGSTSILWFGQLFTPDQFKALATVIAVFVTGCVKVIKGESTTLPSNTATMP